MGYFETKNSLENVLCVIDFYERFEGKPSLLPFSEERFFEITTFYESIFSPGTKKQSLFFEDLIKLNIIVKDVNTSKFCLNMKRIKEFYDHNKLKFYTDDDIKCIKDEGSALLTNQWRTKSLREEQRTIINEIRKFGRNGAPIEELTKNLEDRGISAETTQDQLGKMESSAMVYQCSPGIYKDV